ncbi:MAG TPA: hypothetical protein VNF47_26145 [Streptosporangiaceae bacterium]|nr:hypothetical protein [Streptosporangiaceae bacterium]
MAPNGPRARWRDAGVSACGRTRYVTNGDMYAPVMMIADKART